MDIYIVIEGDTIASIAEQFGVTIERLANENGLVYPYRLAIGQTIVITYPTQEHVVQEGDTIQSIAASYSVTVMQLLRNNSFLSSRELLYPGETLVISYNTQRSVTTTGITFPFINQDVLLKTLPNLTYLSIFNYRIQDNAEIITYYDDTEIIKMAKNYDVIPLLLISILTLQGEADIETAYDILLNEDTQIKVIEAFVEIMKNKEYLGLNIVLNILNQDNQFLFLAYVKRISDRLKQENLLFFITVNYNENTINEQINYSQFIQYTDQLILLNFLWGHNYGPPAPVSNINTIRSLIDQVTSVIPSEKIIIGKPIIGYDWQLPYIENRTIATSLTIPAALELAYNSNSIIQFDDLSQTPFFYYQSSINFPLQHIVWFIDARSINALLDLLKEYKLNGSGIWNIMIFSNQLWTLINSQFDIVKLLNTE